MKLYKLITYIFCISIIPILGNAQTKKLIEFGWDYPDVDFLHSNLSKIQDRPFEGIVFSFNKDIYQIFDTSNFTDNTFNKAKLDQLKWGRFTNNFIFTRGYSTTGAQWFNDNAWKKIIKNTEQLSNAINQENISGIIFDAEYYLDNPALDPYVYNAKLYNNKSFQEVYNKVQQRGEEYMKALQKHKPNVEVLSLWLYSLYMEHRNKSSVEKSQIKWPFMLAFAEGMINAKNSTAKVIDGNELAYVFGSPYQYYEIGNDLDKTVKTTTNLSNKNRQVEVANSIFYDYIFGLNNYPNKNRTADEKNNQFKMSVSNALASSDEYAWLYSERIDWWRNNEIEKMNLINEAKNELKTATNLKKLKYYNANNNADYTKTFPYQAVYNSKKRALTLSINTSNINSIQVFKNNKELYKIDKSNISITNKINLKNKYDNKGHLNILVRFNDGGMATSTVFYEK